MAVGYVKLYRQSKEHPFYREARQATRREAWEDVLLNVNHALKEVVIGNRIFTCGPGESLRSLETWAKEWRWSRHRVRDFFLLLQRMSQVQYENLTITIRISVCNWEKYQGEGNGSGTQKERIGTQTRMIKNDNSISQSQKSENTAAVSRIYALYPTKDINNDNRSTGKSGKDRERIAKLLVRDNYPLEKAVGLYVAHCSRKREYLKNFSTFLNGLPDEATLADWEQETDKPQEPKPACHKRLY